MHTLFLAARSPTQAQQIQQSTHLVARAQLERNVFADRRRRAIRARLVALLLPELRPILPLSDRVVHDRLLEYPLDLAGDLRDALAEHAC